MPIGEVELGSTSSYRHSSSTVVSPGRATTCTCGGSLSAVSRAASSASTVEAVARPWPRSAARSAVTTHSGWLCRTASAAAAAPSGTTASRHSSRERSLTRRITALTNPLAPAPATTFARPTVWSTAACVGTRMPSSWWAPRRSTSSTWGSTRVVSRPAARAMTAS